METTHALTQVTESRLYAVSGAPDTRGCGKRPITVRPETLTISFYDGALRWVSVRGRAIRRDGSISTYREIGYGAFPAWRVDPLPAWVADILRAEGLAWLVSLDA